jgi:hypothetical protein
MGYAFPPRDVGIPIPKEIYDKYPEEVKKAWEIFDSWWQPMYLNKAPIRRSDMPAEVSAAMEVILKAPIPESCGATGAHSIYMIHVQVLLIG